MQVLVVDDSSVYRKVLSEIFSEFPDVTKVDVAANGKIALDKARSMRPDLISLDVEMPGMDGIRVLEELKSQGAMS